MEKDVGKYFILALNIKIFIFYIVFWVLGDFILVFWYVVIGDFMVIWGIGDFMFLYFVLLGDMVGLVLLKDMICQLFFSVYNYKDECFGFGWAWDDYGYSY